jgi:hypothetical protein
MQTPKVVLFLALFISLLTGCSKTPNTPIDTRDKYIGDWDIHDEGKYVPKSDDYDITITTSSSGSNVITIYNFGGLGWKMDATVNGDAFHVPMQNQLSSDGSINGNNMTLTYTTNNNPDYTRTCSGVKK